MYSGSIYLIWFIVILAVVVMALIVSRTLQYTYKKSSDYLLQTSLNSYIIDKLTTRFGVHADNIDATARRRIMGASAKSIKPINDGQNVRIQLPNLQLTKSRQVDFETSVSIKELRPWIQRTQRDDAVDGKN